MTTANFEAVGFIIRRRLMITARITRPHIVGGTDAARKFLGLEDGPAGDNSRRQASDASSQDNILFRQKISPLRGEWESYKKRIQFI